MRKAIPTNAKPIRESAKPSTAVDRLRWDDLEVVLALGREGTLSGAAVRLGVNTSTIARRLDGMEANLGVHLFDRTPAGIAPTELAEALMPVAEAMERGAADALRLLEGRETAPEGTVRVTAPPGIANWLVAPLLVELRDRYPRLAIELDASTGYADLTRREADIALRISRPSSGDLQAVKLVEAPALIGAAPRLVRRIGRLADLDDVDWIAWGADLAGFVGAQWLTNNVAPARVALRTSSMDAQIHAARSGLGVMMLNRSFLEHCGLVELPLAASLAKRLPPIPTTALWLVGHRALRNVPRVQVVWEFLAAEAAQWC